MGFNQRWSSLPSWARVALGGLFFFFIGAVLGVVFLWTARRWGSGFPNALEITVALALFVISFGFAAYFWGDGRSKRELEEIRSRLKAIQEQLERKDGPK